MKIQIFCFSLMFAAANIIYAAEGKFEVSQKEEPKEASEDFNLLKGQPDHILANYASNLSDADLNLFGLVSHKHHGIAQNEFKTRPSWLWKNSKIKATRFHAHEVPVNSVFVTNDNKIVSVGRNEHQIHVYQWDGKEYKNIKQIVDDIKQDIWGAQFSPSTDRLVLSHQGGFINVWNMQTGEKINSFRLGGSEHYFELSPDGKTIASLVLLMNYIIFWDLATGKPTKTRVDYDKEISEPFAFSIDGHRLAFKDSSGVGIWNLKTHKIRHVDYDKPVYNLSFLPDGKLVSCEIEIMPPARIAIWDVLANKPMLMFQPPQNIPFLVWSNDGVLLAGVSANNDEISIWHIEAKKIIKKIDISKNNISNQNPVMTLTFSPDDKMIVAGCANGDIVTWKVQSPKKK